MRTLRQLDSLFGLQSCADVPFPEVLYIQLHHTPTIIARGIAFPKWARPSTLMILDCRLTAQLNAIYPHRYLTPYQAPNVFSPPLSAGSDVIFNTPNWSGSHRSTASDLSTPSLTFDSYSSSSSAPYSPSIHGRRRSLTSRPPSVQGPAFPYHDTARGASRHPTRRGSVAAATPYDRHGHATTYGEETSGVRPRRRQSIPTEKEKERERARARMHRENEQRVLMELSRRLPPPTLSRKRSRIEVMTDGMSLDTKIPRTLHSIISLYDGTDIWLCLCSNDVDR